MPETSPELRRQKDRGGFEEIYEVVRVFTTYDDINSVTVRVNIWRYYNEVRETYAAYYERQLDDGSWESADYGQILTGSDTEENAIRDAVGFVREAHQNRGNI